MKVTPKFQDNPEMIHAVIRMNAAEVEALRKFAHAEEGDVIRFQYGAYIVSRGRGWYRLIPNNDIRVLEKMAFALKVIRLFIADEKAKVQEQAAIVAPLAKDNTLRITSFSTARNPKGEWGYASEQQVPADRRPANPAALLALAAKFSHSHARK